MEMWRRGKFDGFILSYSWERRPCSPRCQHPIRRRPMSISPDPVEDILRPRRALSARTSRPSRKLDRRPWRDTAPALPKDRAHCIIELGANVRAFGNSEEEPENRRRILLRGQARVRVELMECVPKTAFKSGVRYIFLGMGKPLHRSANSIRRGARKEAQTHLTARTGLEWHPSLDSPTHKDNPLRAEGIGVVGLMG